MSLMMAFWQPITNLREYVSQNPPVATFFLCLLALVLSFIGLSSYIYTHTLPNPDTTKDWNHLLSSLSQFHLCTKANGSADELVSPDSSPLTEQDIVELLVNATKTPSATSLHVKVPLTVTAVSGFRKDVGLYTTFRASQLHLGGNEIVQVRLVALSENDSCLTISAPTDVLPMRVHSKSKELPPECPAAENTPSPVHVEANNHLLTDSPTCYSLHAMTDPSLTVMLTKEERWMAVRHLLEVSVCLLAVCFVLCLAASLTHSLMRSSLWRGLDLQNEPLIDP